jgi:ABC-type nitrate/sulfonate/bicarbonate transport system ATPase subunit
MESPLVVRDISAKLNNKILWEKISLEVIPGELVSVRGSNGSGKSTFLKCISSLHPISAGEISSTKNFRVMFQDYREMIHPWLTALENIALGLGPNSLKRHEKEKVVINLLEDLNIINFQINLSKRATELSGGEAQLMTLLRVLISKPKLLLLDEPLSAIDSKKIENLLPNLIKFLKDNQISTLMINHDSNLSDTFADKTLYF